MAELQGLGAKLSEAERAGVEILAISPDPNERSQQMADGLRLGYRFLADRDLGVARRYGLVHAGGGPDGQDVPRPATVVLDKDGVVPWLSVTRNFQIRPDPARRPARARWVRP
jgi:peroxiredoxin